MKTKLKLDLLLLALLSLADFADAQGTAISYQGRLNDGGLPATGLYDFTFHVFDAEVDGTDLAGPLGPLPYDAIPVSDGLFNVTLDFGPDIFSGPARWLEISVRANGAGDPIILSPRTPLLPTPYAIFADKAGAVASGTLTVDQLNTGGVPPTPGQFLSYDGASFLWKDPGALVGDLWSDNGSGDAYYNAGKVGIGTTTPANKLTVHTPTLEYGIEHTDGDIRLGTFVGRATGYLGTLSNHRLTFFANDNGLENMTMSLVPGGNVGIGTATPARKLTVRTPGYGFEHTDGTVRLGTYLNPTGGWLGTVSDHPLKFFVNDGVLPSVTIDGNGTSMASGPGFVSVGTPNGESGLTITRGGNRADVRFEGSTLKLVAGPIGGPPASTRGIAITTAGNVGIGTTTPSRTLEVFGDFLARDISCRVLEIRGGADLAEPFAMSHGGVEPGSVVVIDENHPGKLCRSNRAYDNKVAGIVSGANGIRPGISMVQEDALEAGENVALSGRVYVQADAAFGAIKPGDLLTTSDTPGHAMKVTEHGKAQGAILGKAMSGLKAGKGMVLVLVTLQ
jgi:hypothetical protein